MKRKTKESGLSAEFNYATHHHLIPLYIVSGVLVLLLLIIGCYVTILWQNSQREALRPSARLAVESIENLYLQTAVSPVEKKQYVYSANVRFPVTDAYKTLRYTYDPGLTGTKTSSTIGLSTSQILQQYETPVLNNLGSSYDYIAQLQRCSRLFVVRFEPGVTPYGGFSPLQDVKLKDGRTAYVHKNINCVPKTTQAMTELDEIQKIILAIESY